MQIIIIESRKGSEVLSPLKNQTNNNTLFKINQTTLIKYNKNSTPASMPNTRIVNITDK